MSSECVGTSESYNILRFYLSLYFKANSKDGGVAFGFKPKVNFK